MRRLVIALFAFMLDGCTSQFALGPAAWSTAAPVIPGFTAVPLGGGGFIEEPNSLLQPPAPAEPAESPIQTVITGLEQAQKVRTLTRQLAR
jgi:hypothetical protein